MSFLSSGASDRAIINSKTATALALSCKTFSLRGIMRFPMRTVVSPHLVVAARLHDLFQSLLDSVPVIGLCGKGQ